MWSISAVSQKPDVKHEVVWPASVASQNSDEEGVLPCGARCLRLSAMDEI